ncbi:hypothetical protein DCC85_13980 [Paenibacillus sp. CAA11]|uniref:general stress protein n=1 Tax=Paenibacillus sp. CAA11 TaxID=1532905 RepID=UPI000D37648A|nr:general stress protein [Paenibacillus sp. CAA11]AWB45226.1 hypothetical protein DCC85_13980 [Paenibacillus sp. CAA11]
MKLAVAVFQTRQDASLAVHDIMEEGVSHKDISVIAKDLTELQKIADDNGLKDADPGTGGGVFGTLRELAGIAKGSRGEAGAMGAATKMTAGTELWREGDELAVALMSAGIPDEDARNYQTYVRKEHYLVLVACEEPKAERIRQILSAHQQIAVE